MLVLDADRTLTAEDTVKLFWEAVLVTAFPLDIPMLKKANKFTVDVFIRGQRKQNIDVIDPTDRTSAKLLKTAMRDARNNSLILYEAHRRGHFTDGYRLFHEDRTLIVSLMRVGGPMAHGAWDMFPSAIYFQAKNPTDVKLGHLDGQINILLVDLVINSGKSIAEFVQHICNLHATIRIVVVASVV
ncbi:hypothetical protein TSTA_117070 [Talaromyces stipitatus ATCC 10500]|uniref:Phosphoribosyltransferase domain-containing protein n=1 Tax=Talaromyces stipitatus (strain ATCC 10500 / CBS 375.48 / QM 6759 / NRRL 1006) TaxID=441959 RepID=B8MDF8_TALSN|nr:uncharacterized protein TSTA_117070 [Talaromyces stipitatus ATCC 10500]EED17921.1 hypothetical protein TSTA_117070 [Talaromyces stipitatus ATCC 10500]